MCGLFLHPNNITMTMFLSTTRSYAALLNPGGGLDACMVVSSSPQLACKQSWSVREVHCGERVARGGARMHGPHHTVRGTHAAQS